MKKNTTRSDVFKRTEESDMISLPSVTKIRVYISILVIVGKKKEKKKVLPLKFLTQYWYLFYSPTPVQPVSRKKKTKKHLPAIMMLPKVRICMYNFALQSFETKIKTTTFDGLCYSKLL